MPEGILEAVWAFCWGVAAASGLLVGALLGLRTRLSHRTIAGMMSLGAGLLLSLASVQVASEALMLAGAASTAAGIVCRGRYVQHRERSSCERQGPQALWGMQAATLGIRGAGQRHLDRARHRT